MARSRQGASVVDRAFLLFGRRVRDTVEVHIAAFTGRLARAMAEAVDDGRHSGWTMTPATREAV
jgi:hypothetical protein